MPTRTPRLNVEVRESEAPILIDASRSLSGPAGFGFEGGRVLVVRGQYHLFTAEILSEPIWVHTALAHWSSPDGVRWMRQSTIRESTGDYTGVDREAALFSPMPVFDPIDDNWHLFFVGYRSEPDEVGQFRRNHSGRVLRAPSTTPGLDGIAGPYEGEIVVLEPGAESQSWEGLQGTDSFFPFPLADGSWAAFYGSATTEDWARARWGVGLAEAESLAGTWKRRATGNPLEAEPLFIENPVVQQLDDGLFLALYEDNLPEHQNRCFGMLSSNDGLTWVREPSVLIPPNVATWASRIRTPLGMVPIEDGYRVYFTAFDERGSIPGEPTYAHVGAVDLDITADVP